MILRLGLLISIGLLAAVGSLAQEAFVTLKYSEDQAEEERYFVTPLEDGNYCLSKRFRIAPDLDGYTRLKIKLSKPGFIYTSGRGTLYIYVEPNANIFVDIGEVVTFKGDLRKENTFLNRFHLPLVEGTAYPRFIEVLRRCTSTDIFRDSLIQEISRDLGAIRTAAAIERKMDPELKEFMFRNLLLSILFWSDQAIEFRLANERNQGTLTPQREDEWQKFRGELFPDSLVNCGLTRSADYVEFLLRYGGYLYENKAHGDLRKDSDSLAAAKNLLVTDQYFSGPMKESYMSGFISQRSSMGASMYNSYLLDYFNQFEREFPRSKAISALEPEIKKMTRYLGSSVTNTRVPGVEFIPDYQRISTYDSLMKRFRGKVVLIDFWATWCSPCIEEFSHYDRVKSLAADHKDFVVLFISRDQNQQEPKWRQFVLRSKLAGYHLIPSPALQRELRARINYDAIPRYAIVDKAGILVNSDAPSPSSGLQLEKELLKYLK